MKRKFAALRCAAAAPTGLLADVQRLPCVASGLQAKRLAAISVKGDWPFLISAGNLVRNFRRAPKQGHTSGGAGICHLCLAGQQNYPFLIVEKIRGGLALKAALQLRLRGIQ